jgi:hypothetical protein
MSCVSWPEVPFGVAAEVTPIPLRCSALLLFFAGNLS